MSVTIEGVGFQPKEGLVDNSNKFIHNYPIVIRTTLSMVSLKGTEPNIQWLIKN